MSPKFRNGGVATQIKQKVFQLSRDKYPDAKVFGLTTGLAVMKINSDLGYKPVIYSELTQDEEFWNGCKNCVNYEILMMKERKTVFVQPCYLFRKTIKKEEVVNNLPENKYDGMIQKDFDEFHVTINKIKKSR